VLYTPARAFATTTVLPSHSLLPMRDKDPEPALTAEAELKVAATFL
jgi:hypothetical protein